FLVLGVSHSARWSAMVSLSIWRHLRPDAAQLKIRMKPGRRVSESSGRWGREQQIVSVPKSIVIPSGLNIPNLGRNIPNVGIKGIKKTGLADALFTRGQQRVLGILFSEPDRSFPATELIALAGVGTGAVHRELTRLVMTGVVTVTPMGRQRRYQANRESPVFPELHGLVQKTVGLAEPLRKALAPLSDQIRVAFVYGSVAKGTDTAGSDIDLMLISDDLSYAEVFGALQEVEPVVGRPINPSIFTASEWRKKRTEESPFVDKVSAQPKVFILGSEDDLV
ncbi:MAG: nucleotidyltransferase domain-containing protein, partial [Actinobacteria bacterium]|nr:nucleotidyltransferase domain-containing protein [Actinomycetota bacterium]